MKHITTSDHDFSNASSFDWRYGWFHFWSQCFGICRNRLFLLASSVLVHAGLSLNEDNESDNSNFDPFYVWVFLSFLVLSTVEFPNFN
jgi:hypothetical protein